SGWARAVLVGDAHPALAGHVATNDARRVADGDRVVGKVARDDGTGTYDDVLTDRGAPEDERAVAQPRPRADAHRARRGELTADRLLGIDVPVVGVRDVHVMSGPHVVADLDALVADDATPLPDHAAVSDADDGAVEHLFRRHTRRERGVRPDDAALADVDRAFAEQRRHRKADRAALAEMREPARAPVTRPDGADVDCERPSRLHEITEDAPGEVDGAENAGGFVGHCLEA